MDVFEAVKTLLAVRRYKPGSIPPEQVHRIVEAGHLTASSMNLQPWHFVVVEDQNLLKQLGAALTTGPYTADASIAIAVAYEKDSRFGVSDGSRAIQSMMLTAWDFGIGSNWVGFAGGLSDARDLLGIPDHFELLAVIPFGYPAQATGHGNKKRKPLNEVASRNHFGQPFS